MTDRVKTYVKVSVACVILGAAAVLGVTRLHSVVATGEEGAKTYFYDLSERKLYAAPRYTIPPDTGIGGESGGGVRAVVIAWRNDAEKRRIAYLETYTPELAKVLRDVQAARASGRKYEGKAPAGDSPFVLKNTLVRREGESEWHDMTTAEGRTIVSEWQSESGPDGSPPVVCVP